MLPPRIRTLFLYSGLTLVGASVLLLGSSLTGILTLPPELIGGESAFKSVIRLTVAGLVLAAIGSWEEPGKEFSNEFSEE